MGELQHIAPESAAVEPTPVNPAPAQGEGAALLSMIERMARDPSIDPDRIERFLLMAREARSEQARVAYATAMAACQAELPRVVRDAKNTHSGARYARLESIARATAPVITGHGFSLSFSTGEASKPDWVRILCTVRHSAGHQEVHHLDLPPDAAGAQGKANKTAIQAVGSTITYGRRYVTLQIFNIALADDPDDDDGVPDDVATGNITEEQAMNLRELVASTGASLTKFLAVFKVASLEEIPAARADEAFRILKERERARAGR